MNPVRAHEVWLPLLMITIATWLLSQHGLDFRLADALFGWEGGQWALRNDWLLKNVIHEGGRDLVTVVAIFCLFLLAGSYLNETLKPQRRPLLFLVITLALSLAAIPVLKEITQVACPWSLERYGGNAPSLSVIDQIFLREGGHCFPAGHASSGYAWLALYFCCRAWWPRWRYFALAGALSLGLVFGFAQQLRGAHFLSHDLWTLTICWFMGLAAYAVISRPSARRSEISLFTNVKAHLKRGL